MRRVDGGSNEKITNGVGRRDPNNLCGGGRSAGAENGKQ